MKSLLIRADSDTRIGNGHVMRCLALAEHWQEHGGKATFLSRCESSLLRQRVETSGVELIQLENAHPDPADLTTTLGVAEAIAASSENIKPWIILDGYHLEPEYQLKIRSAGYRSMIIDDKVDFDRYHARLLLNQNIASEKLAYRVDDDTRLLLGARYALLRKEFLKFPRAPRKVPDIARKVLVSLGGADTHNVTAKVIDALRYVNLDNLEVTIVVGSSNPRYDELRSRAAAQDQPKSIRVIHNASNMPQLMARADVAIANAGSTCYELAYMGLPALVLILADNQAAVAGELSKAGIATNLGLYTDIDPAGIGTALFELCNDYPERLKQSKLGTGLIDGKGAERIIEAMREADSVTRFRLALPADAEVLWRLANDAAVRKNSFSPAPISLPDHLAWFDARLESSDCRIWVIEVDDEIAAQIRYDRIDTEVAEIDFSVATDFRNRGLGTQALMLTRTFACDELGVKRIRGIVINSNASSAQAFLKAGFTPAGECVVSERACALFEWGPLDSRL